MRIHYFFIVVASIFSHSIILAQDSLSTKSVSTYISDVKNKAGKIDEQLDRTTTKALNKLEETESKMREKLMKLDSLKAKQLFPQAKDKIAKLSSNKYISSIDTMMSSLNFLSMNDQWKGKLSNATGGIDKLKEATGAVTKLKDEFNKASSVTAYLKERKQLLNDQLGKLGFTKELKKINKQAYYYSQQLSEYKSMLKDHKKAAQKALTYLKKTKPFQEFMRKNSELSKLFRLPDDPTSSATMASLQGLQTRVQVQSLIQQQLGPNAQTQVGQSVQQGQAELNDIKNKLLKLGGNSSEDIMPDGFKPNSQKTKSFLKRLEYSFNIQTQKARYYFPTTSDLGLSMGYKLNDRSVIGMGASYKMGLGRGWNAIKITHEGIGLRSFVDWKIKGNLWITGGYEQNYLTAFSRIEQLKDMSHWQQSGLIGVSKTVPIKTKVFSKTKLQMLWDILSYKQVPKAQPILFRVNYNIR